MKNAVAFANNDIAMIAWSYGKRPDNCMGFAIYRIDPAGKETPLPSHAVFPGEKIERGQTTEQFPVQKFYWKDLLARRVAEDTGNFTFRYKIVPLEGKPDSLTPMKDLPFLTTNEVELTSRCSKAIAATFNRGLISTQHVSSALRDKISKGNLLDQISDPKNQLRKDLSGQMVPTLTNFLKRADKGGAIYAALYELTDTELIPALKDLGKKLNIVLADIQTAPAKNVGKDASLATAGTRAVAAVAVKGKKPPKPTEEENKDAKDTLSASAGKDQFFYRLPPSSHIVHNKFLIYVDASGKPQAVLSGSTNWTDTGLCAQTNNAFVIDDPQVAQRYLDYWETLKADQVAHEKNPKSFQAPPMRTFDGKSKQLNLDKSGPDDPSTLTSYFSPNTPKARSRNKTSEAEPIDMKDLETRVKAAKHAVLFLAFIPGTPSITNFAAKAQSANKDLFVRGCVTSPDAAGTFYYALRGTSPPKKQRAMKGQPKPKNPPVKQDPRVIAADALDKSDAPEGWMTELLKAGFAITHDKIVVIDPFADNCAVVTGSHNLGYQASYNNDENMVIIEGNKKLAMAYATHVLDVYDHFSWRWSVRRGSKPADSHLKTTPDEWLDWYFDGSGNIKTAQLKFWMQATV